jgi:hypothetical protein
VEGDVRIEQQVEVEVRGRDRGDLTPGPKCIERGRQMRPADQVRDGLHRPAREPDRLPREVADRVVHAASRSERPHLLVHGRATDADRNDPQPGRHLQQEWAHSAAAAQDKDPAARRQSEPAKHELGGPCGQRRGGGLRE